MLPGIRRLSSREPPYKEGLTYMDERDNSLNQVADESVERCPSCGGDNSARAEKCASCGQRLQPRSATQGKADWGGVAFPNAEVSDETPSEPGPIEQRAESAPIDGQPAQDTLEGRNGPDEMAKHIEDAGAQYYFPPAYTGLLLQPAGVMRRAAALAADWIIISLLTMVILQAGGMGEQLTILNNFAYTHGFGALAGNGLSTDLRATLSLIAVIELGLAVGMYIIFAVFGGSTPGMRFVGIQVCRMDGADITISTAILRTVLLWAFIYITAGFYLLVAGLYILIDPRGRSVHDMLAGTNVFLR